MKDYCSKAGAIASKAKISRLLVLVLFLNVFIYQGLYLPASAGAAVSFWDFALPSYAVNPAPLRPSYPSATGSVAQGDVLILMIGMKPATANGGSVTTPSGWTPIASRTAEGGYGSTLGIDTGNTNLYTFYKVADGTESAAGSLTVTMADYDATWAVIWRYIKTLETWSVAGSTGADTLAGGVSISLDSNTIDIAKDDSIIGAMCVPTDNAGLSNVAFSLPGAAFGTVFQVYNPQVSSSVGNDVGSFIARTTVTSTGTVIGNPTMTATAALGTNAMGPGVFMRIRDLGTPPTTGGLAFDAPVYGSYTGSPFTFHGSLTDNESAVTSCQYCVKKGAECTDSDVWQTGALTGSAPTWTCTAGNVSTYSDSGAIASGDNVCIDVRGTSTGGRDDPGGIAVCLTMDKEAPSTSDDGPVGPQPADFTVNLICTDLLAGCNETRYSVDGGTEQTGNSILISTIGDHTISYYSIDNLNNSESPKTVHAILHETHTLTVNKAGTGSGTVTGGGIDCGNLCSLIYETGTQLDLTVSADNCSFFSIWGDACNTNGTVCHLAMTVDRNVVATFEKYPLVWTTSKENGFATITDAYQNTPGGGTFHLQEHNFTEDLLLTVDVIFEGGYDCNCLNITGSASVSSLTISDGSATIGNGIFVIGQ